MSNKIKTADEIINEVAETLKEADGTFIEEIANMVLTHKVTYMGDSFFNQIDNKCLTYTE